MKGPYVLMLVFFSKTKKKNTHEIDENLARLIFHLPDLLLLKKPFTVKICGITPGKAQQTRISENFNFSFTFIIVSIKYKIN